MSVTAMSALSAHRLHDLHARFLAILPKIETHGRIYFRHLPSDRKAEVLQELLALAWKLFLGLAQRGKDPAEFISTFNTYLALAVHNGRRLVGMEKTKDALSPRAQKKNGFKVESLPTSPRASYEDRYAVVHGQQDRDTFEERLQDNTLTPIPDQVAFRIDWPLWMLTRTDRDRRIINELMAGARTQDVSHNFGLSQARVSQLRGEFHDDWERFGELDD